MLICQYAASGASIIFPRFTLIIVVSHDCYKKQTSGRKIYNSAQHKSHKNTRHTFPPNTIFSILLHYHLICSSIIITSFVLYNCTYCNVHVCTIVHYRKLFTCLPELSLSCPVCVSADGKLEGVG